jgi:soluble lytic murein transglycosylase-like protein
MSSQAISVQGVEPPATEQSIAGRIEQLQALLAQVATASGAAPARTPASTSEAAPASFATALAAASGTAAGPEEGAGSSGEYDGLIQRAASRYGLDPAILHGLIQQESGFNPNSQSSAGAMGLTQLMPGTASSLGVRNPLNPTEAIEGGARYLAQLMSQFGGNPTDALAAYNAGPGAVSQYGGVPPYAETQSYVTKVLGYAETYRQSHPTTTAAVMA